MPSPDAFAGGSPQVFGRASPHLLAIIEPSQPVWSYGATRHTPNPEDNVNTHAETDQDTDDNAAPVLPGDGVNATFVFVMPLACDTVDPPSSAVRTAAPTAPPSINSTSNSSSSKSNNWATARDFVASQAPADGLVPSPSAVHPSSSGGGDSSAYDVAQVTSVRRSWMPLDRSLAHDCTNHHLLALPAPTSHLCRRGRKTC